MANPQSDHSHAFGLHLKRQFEVVQLFEGISMKGYFMKLFTILVTVAAGEHDACVYIKFESC